MKLKYLRQQLNNPIMAGLLCSVLVILSRPFGQETAQAFRRLVDYSVSKNDRLFEYASGSAGAAESIHALQAWGAWIIYGLVTALIAMAITRWLARVRISWIAIALVVVVWSGIYLLFWNWDNELIFVLARDKSGVAGQAWGAWPYAGSFGYFGGFITGLIAVAAPWRMENQDPELLKNTQVD